MIDVDFAPDDREAVYNYMIDKFGEQYTAYILAIGTVSDKGCIDEIGRALYRKTNDEKYSLESIKVIKKEYEANPDKARQKYPDLFYYFDGLLNTNISQSMHPCGMVVSPITLEDNYGTLYRDNKKILQIDMEDVHEISLVKYDILGLKNIGIIKDACEYAKIKYPKSNEINWDDQKVWEDILRCPEGIFQFEGAFAFQMLCEFKPKSIFDMSLVTAALRPSGASYRDALMKKEIHKNISPIIDELLKDNYGFLVYQCIPESEYINTISGRKYIKDCIEGELIYTKTGVHKINKVIPKQNNSILAIKTKHSNVRCTLDHKVLTHRGWVEAKDLTLNDSLAYRIGGNVSQKSYDKNWLKVIGWYLGDGWVTHKPKIVYMINKNLDVINDFSKCIENINNNLTTTIYSPPLIKGRKTLIYRASVRWKKQKPITNEIFKQLESWGVDKEAANKKIPDFIFELKNESLKYFLGAYTDTDSCLNNGSKITCFYKTVSKELAEGLREIIRLLGYSTQVQMCDTGSGTTAYGLYVDNATSFLRDLYNYSIKVRKKYTLNELSSKRDMSGGLVNAKYVENILIQNNISPRMAQRRFGISVRYKDYVRKSTIIKLDNIYDCFSEDLIRDDIVWSPILDIKNDGKEMTYDLSIDKDHTFLVNGLVVHNCDVLKFLQQICGLSGSEADNVRRAIARKQMDRLEKALPGIQEGYIKTSKKPREEALNELQEYIQILIDSSSYMFGYNHSVAYCMIGYLCAYLRYYHTPYFITAYLNNAANEDDIIGGFEMAKLYGYQILPPRFRHSTDKYVYDEENNNIYKGVASIKYLNSGAAEYLYSLRHNKYNNLIELLIQIEEDRQINSRQMEILIQLQYFDEFGKNKKLLEIYKYFKTLYGRKTISKDKMEDLHITLEDIGQYFEKETKKQFTNIDYVAILSNIEKRIQNECIPLTEQILFEIDIVGYISSIYDVDKRYCLVTDVNTKYSPKVKLYSLGTGKEVECKINKNLFNSEPFKKGQIIKCGRFFEKNRQRKTETGWEEISEKDWWLSNYELIDNLEL